MTRLLCRLFGHDPALAQQPHIAGERAFGEWYDTLRQRFHWPHGTDGCARCGRVLS